MNFKSVLRWALFLLSLLAIGPLCSAAMAAARDADGGHAVSMLVGGDITHGLAAGLLIFTGAVAVGWIGARFFALPTGFACAGLVLAWGAWRTGTFDQVIRRTHSASELPMLAAEGAVAVLASSLIAWVCWHASRAHRPGPQPAQPQSFLSHFATTKDDRDVPRVAIVSMLVSAAAGAAAAYVAAATPLKGQAVIAAVVGAIAAGAAAQIAAQGMHATATPVSVVLGLLIPAVAAPLIAGGKPDVALTAQTYANSVLPIAKVMPLDWAAGAVLGVPIGLGWAGAMMDVRMV